MRKKLTEAPVATSVAAWKRSHNGEAPDTNSEEFKQFKQQVDRAYNMKQGDKLEQDQNTDELVEKLCNIIKQVPDNFPQEFYNALTLVTKKGKVKLCQELINTGMLPEGSQIWVEVIANLYNSNKTESAEMTLEAMKESSKYPWISGLLNHRLIKEDDFNLDNFDASVASAGGMDISSDSTSSTDSTDTSTDTTSTDDFNLDNISNDPNDLHITPAGGAVDSIGMGGGLDNNDAPAPVDPNAPVYRVIDMIFDPKDPEAQPRVKVQNTKTGETEIKDIFEVDV